jgi:hypothetical protein
MNAPRLNHAETDKFTAQRSAANSTDSATTVSSSLKAPKFSSEADLLAVAASSAASNGDHHDASAPSISQDSALCEQHILTSQSDLSITGFDRDENDSDITVLSEPSSVPLTSEKVGTWIDISVGETRKTVDGTILGSVNGQRCEPQPQHISSRMHKWLCLKEDKIDSLVVPTSSSITPKLTPSGITCENETINLDGKKELGSRSLKGIFHGRYIYYQCA